MKPHSIASPWQRISHILRNENISLQPFALRLGFRRDFDLDPIRRGEGPITSELALRINGLYPAYSIPWLVTGEGVYPGAVHGERPDLSGQIVGLWSLRRTYAYYAGDGCWGEELTFEPGESAWRFQRNGCVVFYERGEAIAIDAYVYDPSTGRIRISDTDACMLRLTDGEMKYADWSEWPAEGLAKYVYRRDADGPESGRNIHPRRAHGSSGR